MDYAVVRKDCRCCIPLELGEHAEEVGLRGHQKVRADPTAKTVREHCLKTQVAAVCK